VTMIRLYIGTFSLLASFDLGLTLRLLWWMDFDISGAGYMLTCIQIGSGHGLRADFGWKLLVAC
jgi:hypothetical protein